MSSTTSHLELTGVICANCAETNQSALLERPGVSAADHDYRLLGFLRP